MRQKKKMVILIMMIKLTMIKLKMIKPKMIKMILIKIKIKRKIIVYRLQAFQFFNLQLNQETMQKN